MRGSRTASGTLGRGVRGSRTASGTLRKGVRGSITASGTLRKGVRGSRTASGMLGGNSLNIVAKTVKSFFNFFCLKINVNNTFKSVAETSIQLSLTDDPCN